MVGVSIVELVISASIYHINNQKLLLCIEKHLIAQWHLFQRKRFSHAPKFLELSSSSLDERESIIRSIKDILVIGTL